MVTSHSRRSKRVCTTCEFVTDIDTSVPSAPFHDGEGRGDTPASWTEHYIEAELRKIADHLQTEVEAYLVGGGAMALHQPSLKDTTKDIDLVVVDETALSRLMGVLDELGYE